MESPAGTRARGAQTRARRTRAATYNDRMFSTRAVSQRPMSWLKAAASQKLRAAHGGSVGTRTWVRATQPRVVCGHGAPPAPTQHARLATRRRAGPAGSSGGERETYVPRMFTTCAVSQSARLLLKRADCANRCCVVFARDTSHLPARRERERARVVSNRARAGGRQHQPPRLPGVPQRVVAWSHVGCAASWLSRSRRPRLAQTFAGSWHLTRVDARTAHSHNKQTRARQKRTYALRSSLK